MKPSVDAPREQQPDARGWFGEYGGRFVPETLVTPLLQLQEAYDAARQDAAFQERLRRKGIVTTTRRTRGDDIDAACGQLAGKVRDRVRSRLSGKGRKPE